MNDKEYLTVKEFSNRAGISTQRTYQLLAKDLQSYCKVIASVKYVHISALERFTSKPICKDLQEDLQSDLQSICKHLQAQIDTLQGHNELLTKQLEVKDNQIKTLTESLQATTTALTAAQDGLTKAQALHAGTLQTQLTTTEKPEPVEPVKRGLFSRIFKKGM